MKTAPIESIIADLSSEDWLKAGMAIRKLLPHGESVITALPALFRLTIHDKAPVACHSYRVIQRLEKRAVPFLRERAVCECPEHRAMAITLLSEAGFRWLTSVRLEEQRLDQRHDELPDWGVDPEEIISLFRAGLRDPSLRVRYRSASALEEFGRHLDETIPVFIAALQHGTQHEKNWAALHLGRIGPLASAASDELLRATESECRYTALASSNALKSIRFSE